MTGMDLKKIPIEPFCFLQLAGLMLSDGLLERLISEQRGSLLR